MGKKPKPKSQRGVHTAVVLPPDMLERLRQSERGVSEEIRRRLTESFEAERHDQQTRDLQYAVAWMAEELARQANGAWHTTRKGREALAAAIQTWLELNMPKASGTVAVSDLFGPDDPPTLGRSIARHFQRHELEMHKALQLLRGDREP
jgi:hypothetical protein